MARLTPEQTEWNEFMARPWICAYCGDTPVIKQRAMWTFDQTPELGWHRICPTCHTVRLAGKEATEAMKNTSLT